MGGRLLPQPSGALLLQNAQREKGPRLFKVTSSLASSPEARGTLHQSRYPRELSTPQQLFRIASYHLMLNSETA